MRRRLCTIVSTVLGVAAMLLWIRSSSAGDVFIRSRARSEIRLCSVDGLLWFGWGHRYQGTPSAIGWQHIIISQQQGGPSVPTGLEQTVGGDLGIVGGTAGGVAWHGVGCPYYVLCVLFFVFAIVGPVRAYARRAATRSHARDQLCARCGYDLTGNISGTCPECGTPVFSLIQQHRRA